MTSMADARRAAASRIERVFAVYREIYPRTAPLHEALQRATDG
jgi:hypothetical protein